MKLFVSFLLIALPITTWAGPDYFPNFYGDYLVRGWVCESTFKDTGCADSARIVIESINGVSNVSVFNSHGARIRLNELVEKGDAKSSYVLSGDADSAAYTVEARDSKGTRYFYNFLEIRRLSNGRLEFSHVQESSMAGLTQNLKRVFELNSAN